MDFISSQFGNPRGFIGHLVGLIMAYENRARNHWALSLLDIQPGDYLLEIGFGPGWAIQQAARLTSEGLVSGVDRSSIMVYQATLRNRTSIKNGKVTLRHGSAMEIPFQDAIFDKTFAVNSFHEWEETGRCLQEIRRVMVSGGTLLIVEHPHRNATEEQMWSLGNAIGTKMLNAGFEALQFTSQSIDGRLATGIKAKKV